MDKEEHKKKFLDLMEEMWTVLPGGELTKKAGDIYYEHFKNTDIGLLTKAVHLLEDTYSYKHFPLVSEIKQAVKDAFNDTAETSFNKEPEGCDECHGTGIILKEKLWHGVKYSYAVPCTCAKGKIYQKAWSTYAPRKIKIKGKPK